MSQWEDALGIVAGCLNEAHMELPIPWLIVGSVASELQGCAVGPRDIDILFASIGDLKRYADLVADRTGQAEPSIISDKFSSGFEWHRARHEVAGFLVDAVYIASGGGIPDSIAGDGAWEGGPFAWGFARVVSFREFTIRVAPLEIQLESQLRRGCEAKAAAIAATMRTSGYDPVVLEQCLSREHYNAWAEALGIPAA